MDKEFDFKADLSGVKIPLQLNNPFGLTVPDVVKIAAQEFQEFISEEYPTWRDGLLTQDGKMFGVLVVQREDGTLVYLGAASGKLPKDMKEHKFVPSVFQDEMGGDFIGKGMTELSAISKEIREVTSQDEVGRLTAERKQKSVALQRRLFEYYRFLNIEGIEKNVIEIFESSTHGNPPSAAGECAAPKLLHYAFKHGLKPIALAEFWWGNTTRSLERKHRGFYPACKNKCRPILEFMLDDAGLWDEVSR